MAKNKLETSMRPAVKWMGPLTAQSLKSIKLNLRINRRNENSYLDARTYSSQKLDKKIYKKKKSSNIWEELRWCALSSLSYESSLMFIQILVKFRVTGKGLFLGALFIELSRERRLSIYTNSINRYLKIKIKIQNQKRKIMFPLVFKINRYHNQIKNNNFPLNFKKQRLKIWTNWWITR